MRKHIKVGITQGDFNGIGLEVTLKSIADETILELFTPVIFADWKLIEYARKTLDIDLPQIQKVADAADAADGRINVVDLRLSDAVIEAGKPTLASGAASVVSLDKAVAALKEGSVDVLVTAPISKEAVQSDEFHFPGHTEYLESKSGDGSKAQMILFAGAMRVALVTTHLPISEISSALSKDKISGSIRSFAKTLREDFGIARPKIGVLSLNPHCGDGGLLGNEEKEIIVPALKECEEEGILAFGPFAADGFFGSGSFRNFDGVLAMYHDQGLAPFKTIAQDTGVNFTAGLPFVRTSPDHGTAFDIAWKNEADPTSMREAIYRAIDIYRCRMRYQAAAANPLHRQQPDRANKPEKGTKSDRQHDKEEDGTVASSESREE